MFLVSDDCFQHKMFSRGLVTCIVTYLCNEILHSHKESITHLDGLNIHKRVQSTSVFSMYPRLPKGGRVYICLYSELSVLSTVKGGCLWEVELGATEREDVYMLNLYCQNKFPC